MAKDTAPARLLVGGLVLAVGLGVGWLVSGGRTRSGPEQRPVLQTPAPAPEDPQEQRPVDHRPNPAERDLGADLWVQTSGEYVACCLQTYRLAGRLVRQKLEDDDRPPAVVMDLDETVLDNSGYQTFLYAAGQSFSPATWDRWEREHGGDVRLVPGAGAFIRQAKKLGVAVVYISNRSDKNRKYTLDTLNALGVAPKDPDKQLLLLKEGVPSDKSARRKVVEAEYHVLLYFGDSLLDFDKQFKPPALGPDAAAQNKAVEARKELVRKNAKHWGDDWIILPNPVYGDWTRLIGRRPLDNLRKTSMTAP
jgi:acid phosphatase